MKKKIVLLSLTLALIATAIISGTLAWLTDSTSEVKNTFTTAGIKIALRETFNTKSNDKLATNDKWTAKMVPGYEYQKDPKVSVENTTTEDIWLFVKFEETNNPSTYLTYTSTLTAANGWTKGEGTGEGKNGIPTNVWYRRVGANDTTKSWYLLEGKHEVSHLEDAECTCKFVNGYVGISENLTKDTMPAASATPSLTYTAYASQLMKNATTEFTAAEAWTNVNPS